jgi:hypothetical protein
MESSTNYIRSVNHMTNNKAMLIGMIVAAAADVVIAIGVWVIVL